MCGIQGNNIADKANPMIIFVGWIALGWNDT